jgi:hypothetical protein
MKRLLFLMILIHFQDAFAQYGKYSDYAASDAGSSAHPWGDLIIRILVVAAIVYGALKLVAFQDKADQERWKREDEEEEKRRRNND